MVVKYLISILLILLPLHPVFAENSICPKNDLQVKDFVKNNEDIIRVFMFAGGSSEGNYLLVDSLKKKYPINHQFQLEILGSDGLLLGQNEELIEVYWGISKVDYVKGIKVDPKNCLVADRFPEIQQELDALNNSTAGPLELSLNRNNESEIREVILQKKMRNKKNEDDWNSFEELAKYRPGLAKLMIENGFPVYDASKDKSALMVSTWVSDLDLTRAILEKKPNIHYALKSNGLTPLIIAVGAGNVEIVKELIQAGFSARPMPPISQNPLCYLGGSRRIRGEKLISRLKDVTKIAKILLDAGADVNAVCNVKEVSTPFSTLDKPEFLAVLKLFLKSGLKLEKSYPKWTHSPQVTLYLSELGYDHDKEYLEKYRNYQTLLASWKKSKSSDPKVIGPLLRHSIQSEDYENFVMIADYIKPNFVMEFPREDNNKYNDCSVAYLPVSNEKFAKYLFLNGFSSKLGCPSYSSGNSHSFLETFVEECRYDILVNVPENEIQGFALSTDKLDRLFTAWNFRRPDTDYDCMRTIKHLISSKARVDEIQVLRKVIELNLPNFTDYFLDFLEVGTLQSALDLYKDDKALLPQNRDFEAKAVPKSSRDYLFQKIKSRGILPKIIVASQTPKAEFRTGVRYPICSTSGDAPAFKRKIETTPITAIPDCSKLTPENLRYFELYEIKDGFMAFIAIVDRYYGSEDEVLLGSKIYVKPELIVTPYYLSDGKMHVPLRKAGLNKVEVSERMVREVGDENFCKGVKNPELVKTRGTFAAELVLPPDFDLSRTKLISAFKGDRKKICK